MRKFIKFLKKFFGVQKYKLYIVLIDKEDGVDLSIIFDELESDLVTKEIIAANCGCGVDDVTITRGLVVSQSCMWELTDVFGVENIKPLSVKMAS